MIRNLRERLNNELKSYHAVELSKQHLENTIQVSRIIYDKRRKMRKICTIEMIVNQFRFIAVPVYFLQGDRKSTRLNSSHIEESRMPSSA